MSLTEHLILRYQMQISSLTLLPGYGGVFEVTVNGKLVHSRRRTDLFPADEAIDAAVDEALAQSS